MMNMVVADGVFQGNRHKDTRSLLAVHADMVHQIVRYQAVGRIALWVRPKTPIAFRPAERTRHISTFNYMAFAHQANGTVAGIGERIAINPDSAGMVADIECVAADGIEKTVLDRSICNTFHIDRPTPMDSPVAGGGGNIVVHKRCPGVGESKALEMEMPNRLLPGPLDLD